MDESVLVTKCFPASVLYFCISASEVCKDCSPSVEQSLPNEIMADCAGHVGNQCVTIVTDAIHCGSQVLDDQRAKDAEPDDGGILHCHMWDINLPSTQFSRKESINFSKFCNILTLG